MFLFIVQTYVFNVCYCFTSFRLTRVDGNNNCLDEDDPGAIRRLPVGVKEDTLRYRLTKMTILQLKELLSAKPP